MVKLNTSKMFCCFMTIFTIILFIKLWFPTFLQSGDRYFATVISGEFSGLKADRLNPVHTVCHCEC